MSAPFREFGEPPAGGPSKAQREKNRKRRWQSRSDEEISEDMDTRDLTYRKGVPQLPPLPVFETRQGARALVNDPQELIDRALKMCETHRLHVVHMYFAFRVPEVPQPGDNYLTLVISADLSSDPIVHSLIIQLRKLILEDVRHENIYVELIDDRVVQGLFTFPISPSEDVLLTAWQSVGDIVLEEIGRQKQQWLTLELAYRGLENDAARCPATVIITSPTAADIDWINVILPKINLRLPSVCPHLVIELLCGRSLHLTSSGCVIDEQLYNQQVPMGSSIGQSDLKSGSGTTGGVLKLKDGNAYALTNHHVVRNEKIDNTLKNLSTPGQPASLMPGEPSLNFENQRFNCPSNEDHELYVVERSQYKAQFEKQSGGAAKEQLAKTKTLLEKANQTLRGFGTLHASSGLRTIKAERLASDPKTGAAVSAGEAEHRFLLDWSLIALDCPNKRSMTNSLPLRPQHTLSNNQTLLSGQQCNTWTVMNNPKCHILRDEVNVGKFGRTTGFTYGTINPAPVVINPVVENAQYQFIAATYGVTTADCGAALSMYAHSGDAVDKGDSGSIIVHAPSGDWLGLLFGETRTKAALFTPIDLVFRDIEKVTGQQIISPVFNRT